MSGLAAAALTSLFLPLSGGHLSPATTLAGLLVRRLSPARAAALVVAQCGGAVLAAGLALGLGGGVQDHFPEVGLRIGPVQVLSTTR